MGADKTVEEVESVRGMEAVGLKGNAIEGEAERGFDGSIRSGVDIVECKGGAGEEVKKDMFSVVVGNDE